MAMKVLGVDPGLAHTGVAVVLGDSRNIFKYSFGSVTTNPQQSEASRLSTIYDAVSSIVKQEKPDLLVVEEAFSLPKYPRSGILLGKVTGVVMLAGCQEGVCVREIAVREAKRILTGNGRASKKQLELAVRNKLSRVDPIKPDHASDAMALAVIGLFRAQNPISSAGGFNSLQGSERR